MAGRREKVCLRRPFRVSWACPVCGDSVGGVLASGVSCHQPNATVFLSNIFTVGWGRTARHVPALTSVYVVTGVGKRCQLSPTENRAKRDRFFSRAPLSV